MNLSKILLLAFALAIMLQSCGDFSNTTDLTIESRKGKIETITERLAIDDESSVIITQHYSENILIDLSFELVEPIETDKITILNLSDNPEVFGQEHNVILLNQIEEITGDDTQVVSASMSGSDDSYCECNKVTNENGGHGLCNEPEASGNKITCFGFDNCTTCSLVVSLTVSPEEPELYKSSMIIVPITY